MFKSIRIGSKLYGGFGVVLFLLVAVGGLSTLQFLTVQDMFNQYRDAAKAAHTISELQAEFLQARLNVKNYLIDNDPAVAESALEQMEASREHIVTALEEADDPDAEARLRDMNDLAGQYLSAFTNVIDLERRRADLTQVFLAVGPELENALTSVMRESDQDNNSEAAYRAGLMLRELLQARIHSSKFLGNADRTEETRTFEALTAYDEAAPALLGVLQDPVLRRTTEEAVARKQDYQEAFDAVADVIHRRDEIVGGVLDVVGPTVADQIVRFITDTKRVRDTLGPQAVAIISQTVVITISLSVVAILIGVAAAWILSRGIAQPIRAMTAAMERLAHKDFAVQIPAQDHKDEVGEMSKAVQVFKDNGISLNRMQAEQEAEHRRNARRVKTEMFALTNALDEQVRGSIAEVQQQAKRMLDAAVKMAEAVTISEGGATAAANASRESSSSVDAVAAAAEEMASSIAEISRQVSGASDIARRASNQAEMTNERIQGLASAANQVGEVVNLISDIAKQTNLLALNATIEAARAGEAGKGFAVVANEVKTLANQTAKATEDIAGQISTIQTSTKDAVEAIESIVRVIGEINEVTSSVSAAVEEQSAATGEISQNAQQAAQSTQDASRNIEDVSNSTETTGGYARDVKQAATQVGEQIARMLQDLERIVRSGSEEEREIHALRTINVACTIDVGGGAQHSTLLQDVSLSGVGVLDRPLGVDRGQRLTLQVPDLGTVEAIVVSETATHTHIRLDVGEGQRKGLETFVRQRQRG
ncbi:methyl-accepting chemotaxis protein [uncultured Rhodospira sp.]|uniref:HAMP domain-containing methyl-accepting chemotaxis protein n=1 Tax=uncultured Rhodospira sp. TaxID=1936189 RepID=UPI00260DD54C|nr:methyl-accepting chemotaxis protein [uncultured Rhodospira sp.]